MGRRGTAERYRAHTVLLLAAQLSKNRVRKQWHDETRERSGAMLDKVLFSLWGWGKKGTEEAAAAAAAADGGAVAESKRAAQEEKEEEAEAEEKGNDDGGGKVRGARGKQDLKHDKARATVLDAANNVVSSVGDKGFAFLNSLYHSLTLQQQGQADTTAHPVVWSTERDFLLEQFSLGAGEECLQFLVVLGARPLSPEELVAAELQAIGRPRQRAGGDVKAMRWIFPRDISDKRCRAIRRAMLRAGRRRGVGRNQDLHFGKAWEVKHGEFFAASGILRINADGALDEAEDEEDACCACLCLW